MSLPEDLIDLIFEHPHPTQYKIALLGDPKTGKTTLVSRFTERSLEHKATAGADITYKKIPVQSKKHGDIEISAIFWDLAGQPHFDQVRPVFLEGAHCIMYVFDLTSETTLLNIPKWVKTVRHSLGNDVPGILIGNKVDLDYERQVQKEDALKFAEKMNSPYFETSAITGESVFAAFGMAIQRAVAHRWNT